MTDLRPSFPAHALEYDLPESLIAQAPPPERTSARLLVVDRPSLRLEDGCITDLPRHLRPGDALVLNDTRVLPAKFQLRRDSGGLIEGLYLGTDAAGCWEVLLRGARRLRVGESLAFAAQPSNWRVTALARCERGWWRLSITPEASAAEVLPQVGRMPLPPYIKRAAGQDERDALDAARYQTVYAKRFGAVAAPTAGLHFTEALLAAVAARGIEILRVTLHVGYGTFAPLEVDDLADHVMHREYCELSASTAAALRNVRQRGDRVVAVGTTSARVLESAWRLSQWQDEYRAFTDLFCYPPFSFGGVDALVTNFHLPRSTLLALVMAFAGVDLVWKAYAHAIAQSYRFYSYGDAMLIA